MCRFGYTYFGVLGGLLRPPRRTTTLIKQLPLAHDCGFQLVIVFSSLYVSQLIQNLIGYTLIARLYPMQGRS